MAMRTEEEIEDEIERIEGETGRDFESERRTAVATLRWVLGGSMGRKRGTERED